MGRISSRVSGEFSAEIEFSDTDWRQHIRFVWVKTPMSFGDAISLWQWNDDFCRFCTGLLKSIGYGGYVWELPSVTTNTLDQPFEMTITDTRAPYHSAADPSSFLCYFSDDPVASFENLGGDALLLAPTAKSPYPDFRDLRHFLETAKEKQTLALWKAVGAAMEDRISGKPVWLSVAGSGEPWLHIRLDSRPKDYQFEPYRTPG